MAIGLLQPESTALVVIDLQEKLMPVINNGDRVVGSVNKLIAGAGHLDVPVVVTEQYPKGLGHTVSKLELAGHQPIEKNCFSCLLSDPVKSKLEGKRALILCGVEAHICVLKTALDALDQGYEVHVPADAVSSRHPHNHRLALQRMRQSGVFVTSVEMTLFQMLDAAGTDTFKAISALIK